MERWVGTHLYLDETPWQVREPKNENLGDPKMPIQVCMLENAF
jgi:hypothetical protein